MVVALEVGGSSSGSRLFPPGGAYSTFGCCPDSPNRFGRTSQCKSLCICTAVEVVAGTNAHKPSEPYGANFIFATRKRDPSLFGPKPSEIFV